MRTLVVGDIQGSYKALRQVLDKSAFNYENDRLITLGDVCDGLPDTKLCFDELLKVKNLVFIIGNHDDWFYRWIKFGAAPDVWVNQGGQNTLKSYDFIRQNVPSSHEEMIFESKLYFVENNILFVHGGFDLNQKDMEKQNPDVLMWDRDLVKVARKYHIRKEDYKFGGFDEVYVGHTTTENLTSDTKPVKFCNVWMLDTGAGWTGCLTIMDIATKEYWQSDPVEKLYPGVMPRIGFSKNIPIIGDAEGF